MHASVTVSGASVERCAVLGFGLALSSSFGQSYFIGLFGAAVQASAGVDPGRWGLLYGVATLCSGTLMFWAGALADTRPARQGLGVALLVTAAGALALATAAGPWSLLPALFLLRLGGQGLTGHLAMVLAARASSRRGRSLAIAALGFIAGEALLPVSVVALSGALGWRGIWISVAALLVLVAWPVLAAVARGLPRAAARATATPGPEVLRRAELVRHPAFLASLSVLLVPPFAVTAIFLHQASLAELRGWSPGAVAAGFVLFALCQALSSWVSGALVDRAGTHSLLRFYLWPLAGGSLALAFAPHAAALWLLFAGLGLTSGGQGVVGAALWVELFGLRRLGLVRGVFFGFMVLSTAVSPFFLGAALSAGIRLEVFFGVLALYAAAAPLAAAPVLARHPAPRPDDVAER